MTPEQSPLGVSGGSAVINRRLSALVGGCLLLLLACGSARADWPMGRGNPQRTGSSDDQPGPSDPKVLWIHRSAEHFIAAPTPDGGRLYVSGLGPFNLPGFHCLAADPGAERAIWSKSAPYLKRPTVCAPAIVDGLVIFGDGMHQTDGAVLYCLRADTGRPVWQLSVPGRLVHLEGSPAVADGRAYIGGGEAGVLCVGIKTVTLDGKDRDFAEVQTLIEKRWTELTARYEQDKQRDGDLAVPPSEDSLPRPVPKLLWQAGQGKLHVDAPVAVAGGKVFVGSALLEDDKVGKRVLACLNAADGSVAWETPLKINPWSGPTIAGNLVLIGCSSIRLDRRQVKEARGEVVAVESASGQVKWRNELPGGVLSTVAVKGDLAVFTATDGKVRCVETAGGAERWTYDGSGPFFAGPAIAGGMVVAADLKGVVHAVRLADGKGLWKVECTSDPAILSPGMVFGSPVLAGGRVYLATCNLESDTPDQPCVVACIGDKSAAASERPRAGAAISVDRDRRTITVPCRIAPRKLPTLKDVYPLEVVATLPSPQGQKAHETVVTFDVKPSDVHKALEELGLKPGKPALGQEGTATGPEVSILLEFPGVLGQPRTVPIDRAIVDIRTGRPLPPLRWFFTGSALRQPDPEKDLKVYGADLGGTLMTIFPVTDETVFQTDLRMNDSNLLRLETNRNILPAEGTTVKLIIQAR